MALVRRAARLARALGISAPTETNVRSSALALLPCYMLLTLLGCSSFSPKKSFLADYDLTRKSIEEPLTEESPEGEFRPEGVSAERMEGKRKNILDQIGLQTRRRKDKPAAQADRQEADRQFETAKNLEGDEQAKAFRMAAAKYIKAAKNWRSSTLEQDSLLMAAECHFFAEDYSEAEDLYAQLLKEYPRNPYLDHIDSRRFEIADYWLKVDSVKHTPFFVANFTNKRLPLNDTGGHGKRVLEKMRLDNPTGKVSDDATMRLAMEHLENGSYEDAADTFADLRMTYPDSEHQFDAQLLEMQCLLASYQGPRYSSIPIDDAEKRLKQLLRQFPQESAEHEEDLRKALSEVRFRKAERIWTHAKYRRDRQEYGSAKFHYNHILADYDDTPFAEQAREALDEIKGKPDDPPQKFKALVWMFGAGNDERPWRNQTDE